MTGPVAGGVLAVAVLLLALLRVAGVRHRVPLTIGAVVVLVTLLAVWPAWAVGWLVVVVGVVLVRVCRTCSQ